MLDNIIALFTPHRGLLASVTAFIAGILPNFEKSVKDDITFMFQVTAFIITILVGLLTMVNIHMKFIDRRRARKLHQMQKTQDDE